MTRINTGTRQLAINLPTTDYDRLAQAAEKAGISMTLAVRKAVATWTARQIGAYQPAPLPKLCPGGGHAWTTRTGEACCPACGRSHKHLGLSRRPNRKTTTVPVHNLSASTVAPRPAGPEGEAGEP